MHYHQMPFLGLVALAAVSCTGSGEQSNETPVHNVFVTTPEPLGIEGVTTLPATVEEGRNISVGFKTAGQIERIYVKEGATVSKGQLLAVLDSDDYSLGVSALRERYGNLKSETERYAKLHASGNMSDNDYEKATSGLRQLELQLQIEENRLSYCRLTSPASGIVTKVNFENSEMVDAGTPVFELMDNSSLEAIVDLPVRLYTQRAHFAEFLGESALAPGKVVSLNMLSLTPRADNTQLYRLRLAVPANSGFTPGMNINVSIVSHGDSGSGVSVPLSALFDSDGRKYVWKVNPADSVISKAEVTTTGTGENGCVNVTAGLRSDEIIVRAGVHHLSEGEKVAIISENSESNPGNIL